MSVIECAVKMKESRLCFDVYPTRAAQEMNSGDIVGLEGGMRCDRGDRLEVLDVLGWGGR